MIKAHAGLKRPYRGKLRACRAKHRTHRTKESVSVNKYMKLRRYI